MRRPPRPSRLEDLLVAQLALTALPPPVRELRFAPPRRWRADLAWPAARVIVEVDGAVFVRGRHTRGTGFMRDCEKLNAAVLAGWRVLRVTRPHILRGQAVQWITQALQGDGVAPVVPSPSLLPPHPLPPPDPPLPVLASGPPGGRARRRGGRGPVGQGGGEARADARRALASAAIDGARICAGWRGRRR